MKKFVDNGGRHEKVELIAFKDLPKKARYSHTDFDADVDVFYVDYEENPYCVDNTL